VSGALPRGEARSREVSRVLARMLAVSLALVAVKGAAGIASGSLAVLGGAFDSGLDVLTTAIAMAMARVAAREPDDEHPYGHEKFEALGALAMVAFLSVSAYELVRTAIGRLRAGEGAAEVDTLLGVAVMSASLLVGLVASEYERRRGVALGSELLRADAAHLRADVLVSAAVIAGLLLTRAGWQGGDAWTALLVAALIVRAGVQIVRDAVPVLVDERAVEAAEIRGMAEAMEGVRAAYDVRSRGRPGARFAELTIAVPAGLDIAAAHRIADRVEGELLRRLGARRVVVHVEPEEVHP
jgi:cation diffusion facilitator family transporter